MIFAHQPHSQDLAERFGKASRRKHGAARPAIRRCGNAPSTPQWPGGSAMQACKMAVVIVVVVVAVAVVAVVVVVLVEVVDDVRQSSGRNLNASSMLYTPSAHPALGKARPPCIHLSHSPVWHLPHHSWPPLHCRVWYNTKGSSLPRYPVPTTLLPRFVQRKDSLRLHLELHQDQSSWIIKGQWIRATRLAYSSSRNNPTSLGRGM
jgi:hypothetical protein